MELALKVRPKPHLSSKPPSSLPKRPLVALIPGLDLRIPLLLLVAVFAVYFQVRNHELVSFDDPIYVTENPPVRTGLTWDGVAWAFTTFHDANWFPLTWLSHTLDCQIFGLDSGWHHLMNALIHALSTLLRFMVPNASITQFFQALRIKPDFAETRQALKRAMTLRQPTP